jgi:RNA polymerase sigma-70 factor (ECF subfamily)
MADELPFRTLIERVRRGDQEAAAELVRRYEPDVRRMVRLRLTDAHLRRVLDSSDICQSVMANFFVRVAAGQFDLDSPEQLVRLLTTMARNRLLNHAEREKAGRRDGRRLRAGDAALEAVADRRATPSQVAAGKDLLRRACALLSDEERRLAQLRADGQGWAEIARQFRGSPEALRKRLARALERVREQLDADDWG